MRTKKRPTQRNRVAAATSLALLLEACGAEAGVPGRDGEDGVDGAPGIAAIGTLQCSRVDELAGLWVRYQLVEFSTGDVFVTCSVATIDAEASHSDWWLAGQVGADEGACTVIFDTSGEFTGGVWDFTLVGDAAQAAYYDDGDPNDGTGITFQAADCVYVEPTS